MKKNFSELSFATGNRRIDVRHAAAIAKSIERHGYLPGEEVEILADGTIVDGQHRATACNKLKMDVPVRVIKYKMENLPLKNVGKKSWRPYDYANFYAKRGNVQYQYFLKFARAAAGEIGVELERVFGVLVALYKVSDSGRLNGFKTGELVFENDAANVASKAVDYAKRFSKIHSGWKSRPFLIAVSRLLSYENFSPDRFYSKVKRDPQSLPAVSTVKEYELYVNQAYNYRTKTADKLEHFKIS